MKLKHFSTEFEYFTPKRLIFGLIQLGIIQRCGLYLYLWYELPLCKILYQYVNKYWYFKYFPISRDFYAQKVYYFTSK